MTMSPVSQNRKENHQRSTVRFNFDDDSVVNESSHE